VRKLTRAIGNVTSDSAITFEYGARATAMAELRRWLEDSNADGAAGSQQRQIPFQVQLHYTATDGMRCVRVLSQTQRLTADRARAEAAVDVGVIGTHCQQQTAAIGAAGDYRGSRVNARAWDALMRRNVRRGEDEAAYNVFSTAMNAYDARVERALDDEEDDGLALSEDESSDSDDESEARDAFHPMAAPSSAAGGLFSFGGGGAAGSAAPARKGGKKAAKMALKAKKKAKARSSRRRGADDLSNMMMQMKSAPSSATPSLR
jgi:hypothetical protein